MPNNLSKILMAVSIGAVFLPLVSYAQISSALSKELRVEIIPTYPRPNETTSINLALYTGDLNSANITWYQNGKTVLSGKGETHYSFRAGPVGVETKIEIRIRLLTGESFSKIFTLNPAAVDLVWEADSYVPPFYKGKALHPMQGVLKIVALPNFVKGGKMLSSSNLIYKWSNDVTSYQSQSGYGKNVLVLNGSLLGISENIKVVATDPISNLTAQGFIKINPTDPEIVFYEKNPYYGYIFDSAITGIFDLGGEEVQILAAPYYFSKEKSGGLKYEWRLNNQSVPSLSGSRTAIFKRPEEAGRSYIELQMNNTSKILQQADNSLTINFNDK